MTNVSRILAAAVLTAGIVLPGTQALATNDQLDHPGVVVDGREPPKVHATSWIVADADTGAVLAAKNAHERLRPASTLKTLTAITVLPRLNLDDSYRVQWEDAHTIGSAVGIVPGSRYTIDQLFYGMLLPSGNDAARALASAAGGMRKTVRAMNAKADALGAHDTSVVNPTGLDRPGQYSSAFDLALFTREGLSDRHIRRYESTISTPFPAQEPKRDKRRDTYMIYNQNPLLLDGFRGVIGGKTGYTTQAGRTFVATVERGGRTLIVALMGIVDTTETAADRLFSWGFAHADTLTPVGTLNPTTPRQTPEEIRATTPAPQAAGVSAGSLTAATSKTWLRSLLVVTLVGLVGVLWWWRRRRV